MNTNIQIRKQYKKQIIIYFGLWHSHMLFPEEELSIQIADINRIQINLKFKTMQS